MKTLMLVPVYGRTQGKQRPWFLWSDVLQPGNRSVQGISERRPGHSLFINIQENPRRAYEIVTGSHLDRPAGDPSHSCHHSAIIAQRIPVTTEKGSYWLC